VQCASQTVCTLDDNWYTVAQFGPISAWAYDLSVSYPKWNSPSRQSPACYYDSCGASLYSLYYRTGLEPYLTEARREIDTWWQNPWVDGGNAWVTASGTGSYAGYALGANQTKDLAEMIGPLIRAKELEGGPNDMWAGLRHNWDLAIANAQGTTANGYIDDIRGRAYPLARLGLCAQYDSVYASNCGTQLTSSMAAYAGYKDPLGGFPTFWGDGTAFSSGIHSPPTTTISATAGSNILTCVDGAAACAMTSLGLHAGSVIWLVGTSFPHQNTDGDPVAYTITATPDDHHLTISGTYPSNTSNRGWIISDPTSQSKGVIGFGAMPYMEGIMADAFDRVARAATANTGAFVSAATVLSQARSYLASAVNWLVQYGTIPSIQASWWNVGQINCPAGSMTWPTTNGCDAFASPAAQMVVLNAEVAMGMMKRYALTHDAALKLVIDRLFNGMFGKPGTCGADPACVSNANYMTALNDGGIDMIYAADVSTTPWKWFGITDGVANLPSWPALRQAVATGTSHTAISGARISGGSIQ